MSKEVIGFYSASDERTRLLGEFSLERIRSQQIISKVVGASQLRVLDVGGAAGVYSFWLAQLGHRVSLVDLTPKHVLQATDQNRASAYKLESISESNATNLSFDDSSFDLVLLMGPLYHIQDKSLRVKAIRESIRVLKPGGHLVFACISRFASYVDGFRFDLVNDIEFRRILDRDLRTGDHTNTTDNPTYFTDAHLHLPEEIEEEVRLAGSHYCTLYAVEGVGSVVPGIDDRMKEVRFREYLLEKLQETEQERSIIGMSSHFMGVVSKSATF